MSGKRTVLLLTLFIAACAVQPTHQSLKQAGLPPLRDFVANTDYNGHYRISPDGKKLAWKAVAGTREEIFVRTRGKEDTRSLGFDAQGYPFVWAEGSRRLLFIKGAGGNENFHLFRVDTDKPGERPVDITPLPNTLVGIQQLIEDDPAHILVVHNGRDKVVLVRLDIAAGKETVVYADPEVDVSRVQIDRRTLEPALAYTHPDYPQVEALDPALCDVLHTLRREGPAGIYVSIVDNAQQLVTIDVNGDREVTYYLVDRRTGERTLLGRGPTYARPTAALLCGTGAAPAVDHPGRQ